jgi:hypothetical protein
MCVPTPSHTEAAGGPSLLGLSYCLVCPIDSRDEEAKAHPPFICSMQERIHRTMGQRDNCDLTETYAKCCTGPDWDRVGWTDNSTGGERPNAAPDDHNTLASRDAAESNSEVTRPLPPVRARPPRPYERRTSTSLNPFRRTSRYSGGRLIRTSHHRVQLFID